jgi:hypothetical protein
MTSVEIEIPQLIGMLLSFAAMLATFGKVLAGMLDTRLKRIEDQNKSESEGWKRLERELMDLRADLPLQYVRREDYVRGQTVIEAKLDALYNKLEVAQLRAATKEPHEY